MKAYILEQPGGVENLKLVDLPKPDLQKGEVLIQTKAISINPVDIKTRSGKGVYGRLKEQSPLIIGWDVSGVITALGEGVTKYKVGDEVFGMVNFPGHGKVYAEYVAAPESHLAMKPKNVSHEEAAAATLALLTAWQVLVTNAHIKAGQKVLIHAAAGGVGHYAVQIAKHFGAYVIGTSSKEKKAFIKSLGADEHIDYHAQQFELVVKDADFVFDTVGGEVFKRSLDAVKKGGLVISIPSGMTSDIEETAQEKGVIGKFVLVQSSGEDMEVLAKLLSEGKIKSHVSATYTFSEMGEAHKAIETGRTAGKIVVVV